MESGLPAVRVLVCDPNISITSSLCSLCTLANPELAEGERARDTRDLTFFHHSMALHRLSSVGVSIRIPWIMVFAPEEDLHL